MIRRSIFALVTGVALFSSASAADLGSFTDGGLKDTPAFSWTGLYAGGVGSYVSTHTKHCDRDTCALPGVTYPEFDVNGWLGGFELGYNYQIGRWVVGGEFDFSTGSDVKGSSLSTHGFNCVGSCATKIDSIATLRARLGYAYGRFLPYVTAGGASVSYSSSIGTPLLKGGTTSEMRFTAGGGLEYAVTPMFSVKAEYLYIDSLGDFLYAPGVCATPGCFSRTDAINEARFGVNVHIGGYEPLK